MGEKFGFLKRGKTTGVAKAQKPDFYAAPPYVDSLLKRNLPKSLSYNPLLI